MPNSYEKVKPLIDWWQKVLPELAWPFRRQSADKALVLAHLVLVLVSPSARAAFLQAAEIELDADGVTNLVVLMLYNLARRHRPLPLPPLRPEEVQALDAEIPAPNRIAIRIPKDGIFIDRGPGPVL